MSVQRKEKGKGFTIIEVVLVLAIGALIMLMAILAFPALRRSQADTQRKNDLSKVATAVMSFQTNNRGKLPTQSGATDDTWAKFAERYLKSADEFIDPSGTAYTWKVLGSADAVGSFSADTPTVYVNMKATCNGEGVKADGATKVAFRMALEGNGIACVNN